MRMDLYLWFVLIGLVIGLPGAVYYVLLIWWKIRKPKDEQPS